VRIRNIAGLAVNFPDAGRGDLVGKGLLLLLGRKALLREVGPVCAAVMIGRWTDVHRVRFQTCVEPPLVSLIRIAPATQLCRCPRIALGGAFGNPCAEVLRKCFLSPLLYRQLQDAYFENGLGRCLGEQDSFVWPRKRRRANLFLSLSERHHEMLARISSLSCDALAYCPLLIPILVILGHQ
jgi:hypothetical protein